MARLVARKAFTSKKGDLPMVIALNTRTILSIFRDAIQLKYNNAGWGDEEVVQLVEVLPLCKSATELYLEGNTISDRGARALAAAFVKGAMPSLQVLALGKNLIGDDGVVALAEAITTKGVLPQLKHIALHTNCISETGMNAYEVAMTKR